MKASAVVSQLQSLIVEFGDLEVTDEQGAPVDLTYYMYAEDEPITDAPVFAFSVEI